MRERISHQGICFCNNVPGTMFPSLVRPFKKMIGLHEKTITLSVDPSDIIKIMKVKIEDKVGIIWVVQLA